MTEKNTFIPLTFSEAQHYAYMAKRLPPDQADLIQSLLRRRALEAGIDGDRMEVMEVIDSITDRFVEEDRAMRRELLAEQLRREGLLQQEHIDADDDQIVQALKWTLPKFKSDWDWGGPYRILVDCCDFPPKYSDFVRRMARMGVYPKDNVVKNSDGTELSRPIPPAIRGTEWCDHPFSYQALQKGINRDWPKTYVGWQMNDSQTQDFLDRRDAAKLFRENLLRAAKEA